MKFRDLQVDKIKIIAASDENELCEKIERESEGFVIVDLQYSTDAWAQTHSVIILLKKKKKIKPTSKPSKGKKVTMGF